MEVKPWMIIIGLLVGAYFLMPNFKLFVNGKLGGNVSQSVQVPVYQEPISYNNTIPQEVVTPMVYDAANYSVIGKPQKVMEFSCTTDRDCEFYSNLCNDRQCVCLPTGECALKVG
jgi:hypothetical protein